MEVEKCLEMILPVASVRAARIYREVLLYRFAEDPSSYNENLFIKFCEEGLINNKSLSDGVFSRHVPSFNHPRSYLWVRSTLRKMLEIVRLCQQRPSTSYKVVSAMLSGMKGIGELIAQHIIHLMALVGLVPTHLAADAVISQTARISERLSSKGIAASMSGQLLDVVAHHFGIPRSVAENILCKELADEAKEASSKAMAKKHYDGIYKDQKMVVWVKPPDDKEDLEAYRVCVAIRPSTRKSGAAKEIKTKKVVVYRPDKFVFRSDKEGSRTCKTGVEAATLWWQKASDKAMSEMENLWIYVTREQRDRKERYDAGVTCSEKKRKRGKRPVPDNASRYGMDPERLKIGELSPWELASVLRGRTEMTREQRDAERRNKVDRSQWKALEADFNSFVADQLRNSKSNGHENTVCQDSTVLRSLHASDKLHVPKIRDASLALRAAHADGSVVSVTHLQALGVGQKKVSPMSAVRDEITGVRDETTRGGSRDLELRTCNLEFSLCGSVSTGHAAIHVVCSADKHLVEVRRTGVERTTYVYRMMPGYLRMIFVSYRALTESALESLGIQNDGNTERKSMSDMLKKAAHSVTRMANQCLPNPMSHVPD